MSTTALVIGDSCVDIYVYGKCARLCPEGPIPVLEYEYSVSHPGMSGNVFCNLASFIKPDNIDLIDNETAIKKTRYVDERTNQLILRVDENDKAQEIYQQVLLDILKKNYDIIICADYNKGFLTNDSLIVLGYHPCKIKILDSKKILNEDIVNGFTFIKLNEFEYKNNIELVNKYPEKFIITLGARGVMYMDNLYPSPKVIQSFDVSGAGDTFVAVFAYSIYEGKSIEEAINTAQLCCNKVIQKRGTCVYTKDMD